MTGGVPVREGGGVLFRGEHDAVARAVVRVWSTEQEVVGGGFLVGPDLVATCAHVVADAVGGDAYGAAPAGPVELDFPLLRDGPQVRRSAAVVERWVPIADDGGGDIALLRLAEPPPGVRMPPLRRIERLWDHGFRVLGFPGDAPDGVWSAGWIRGQQGTGWFQLQGDPHARPVVGGFSGTPVWEAGSGAVVGMTVAADRAGTTTAYLLPIDLVIGVDPAALPCPYRGLAPFDEEDAALFFGRDDDVEHLVDVVSRQPVVAVAGPSGVGKSSLVRAGLLPRLRARGARIAEVRAVPGVAPQLPEPAAGQVLVLDQFEEFAAASPDAARELLARAVATTADPQVGAPAGVAARVVLTARWSALEEVLTPELATVLESGAVLLASLDRGGLRQAVVGPAERAPGLDFEDGLVERILDDAGTDPGRLPLVAALLADLWGRRDGGRLTLAGYHAAGGVAGAVAQHAERVVGSLDDGSGAVQTLFTRLAGTDREGRFVRRPVRLGELPDRERRLVPGLAAERLLVVDEGGSAGTVQVAHQALIDHWPRLRGWLAEDRDFLAWRARLDEAMQRWEDSARDDGSLLRGAALVAAGDWTVSRGGELSSDQREYVRRSTRRHRREVRRWRVVTAVLAALVLAAGTLAFVAVDRGDELTARLATANADLLGAESMARSRTDPVLAAQLALVAWRSDPRNAQARTALGTAAMALRSVEAEFTEVLDKPSDEVVARGDTAVLAGPDGYTAVTGVTGARTEAHRLADVAPGGPVALSPDGRRLADLDPAGRVRVRELVDGGEPRTVSGPRGGAPASGTSLGFSPDGARLWWRATGPGGPQLQTVDLATGQITGQPLGAPGVELVPTPDPGLVLVRRGSGAPLALRPPADGAPVAPLPAMATAVLNGSAVVGCAPGNPATLTVAPVGGAAVPARTFPALGQDCDDLRITADGGALIEPGVTLGAKLAYVLTDLRTGRQWQVLTPPFTEKPGATGEITRSRVSAVPGPDGAPRLLVPAGRSLLRLRPDPVPTLPGPQPIRFLDHSGRYYVSGTSSTIWIEDRATGDRLAEIPTDSKTHVLITDELWLLAATDDGWQVSRRELPSLRRIATFPVRGAPVPAVAPGVLVPQDGGPLVAVADGRLTALDPASGAPVGGSTPVPALATDEVYGLPLMWTRPGHPGQAALLTASGELQVWDAVAGTRVAATGVSRSGDTLGTEAMAFDPTGARAAVLVGEEVAIWDVESGQPARTVPVGPRATGVFGFDRDGFLVLQTYERMVARIALLDPATGQESGQVEPGGTDFVEAQLWDGAVVHTMGWNSLLPLVVPVTAEDWFDRVCAAVDRPFTAAELALLPPGAGTEPPCR